MFTKPGLRILIAVIALCPRQGSAQERLAERHPLYPAAVVATLQRAGLSVDVTHLQMPQPLSSTSDQPSLQITGAELLSDGRLRVRLSCEDLGQCQPFFVNISGTAHGTELKSLASLRAGIPSGQPARALNRAVLRAGEQTQMFLEDEHMRIAIPVIAIDSGAVGAEVRVASLDHKQTFRAFVVSASAVRGQLP